MAIVEANPQLGERIVDDAKRYVLYSWSVQDAVSPIAVAGAEGRHFWDYDGNRYLDFASQLVNVSIGHQHPRVIAAIKEQAERLCTIGPPMASESRSRLGRLLAEVTPGDLTMSRGKAEHPANGYFCAEPANANMSPMRPMPALVTNDLRSLAPATDTAAVSEAPWRY